jgi:3-phenylpropionate/trans-cinnamate dioxygenase ferredoxin subunit
MAWFSTGVAMATLSPGSLHEVDINGQTIVLAQIGQHVYALSGICTHQGGILSTGQLDGDRITCGEHGGVFDARTGRVLADAFGIEPPSGSTEPLKVYPTQVRDGLIEIEL